MHKRLLVIVLLIFAGFQALFAQQAEGAGTQADAEAELNFQRHLSIISSLTNRSENSPSAGLLRDYLLDFASTRNIDAEELEIRREETFHSYGTNIHYRIPGSENHRLALFVPYVELSSGSASNSALALVLTILEMRDDDIPLSSLEIYFLGSVDDDKGIREYLSGNLTSIPETVIYLEDTGGLGGPIELMAGSKGTVSPLWLLEHLTRVFISNSRSVTMRNSRIQMYRIGMASETPVGWFLDNGFNAAGIRLTDSLSQGSIDSMFHSFDEILFQTGTSVLTTSEDLTGYWDRHYLAYNWGGYPRFIPEAHYLTFVLGVLQFLLIWLLAFRKRRHKYFRTLGKNFWNLPLFYASIFGFIFLGSVAVELVLQAKNINQLWLYIPVSLLLLKIFTATLFFSVFFTLIRKLPISKNGSFYSAATLLLLSLDVVLFGIININYIYYFLWALFWAFIFSITRFRGIKVLSFLLSPLFLVVTIADVIRGGDLRFIGELIRISPQINLLVSFILLPFMLMLIRLDFLFPHPFQNFRRKRGNFTLRYTSLFTLLILAGVVLYIFVHQVFDAEHPRSVVLSASMTRTETPYAEQPGSQTSPARLNLISSGPIGNLEIGGDLTAFLLNSSVESSSSTSGTGADSQANTQSNTQNDGIGISPTYQVSTDAQTQTLALADISSLLTYQLEKRSFLGRTTYRLEIRPASIAISDIEFRLKADADFPLYDANLPYRTTQGSGEILFFSGLNPPDPTVLEFTLPARIQPDISATAVYRPMTGRMLDTELPTLFDSVLRETLIISTETGGSNR